MVWILSLHEATALAPEHDPDTLQKLPPSPTEMRAAASEFEWHGWE